MIVAAPDPAGRVWQSLRWSRAGGGGAGGLAVAAQNDASSGVQVNQAPRISLAQCGAPQPKGAQHEHILRVLLDDGASCAPLTPRTLCWNQR